jgi:intraflagellar transport protein 122
MLASGCCMLLLLLAVTLTRTQAKKYDRAVAILAQHGWWDKLVNVVRSLEKSNAKLLATCATHFRKAGQFQFAKETLIKLDDKQSLLQLYAEHSKWDDAFLLLHAHPGKEQPAACTSLIG